MKTLRACGALLFISIAALAAFSEASLCVCHSALGTHTLAEREINKRFDWEKLQFHDFRAA
jgi:hypothetical protein